MPQWPLLACLMAAETANELQEIADRLRTGSLGRTSVWRESEQRFKRFGDVSSTHVMALARSRDPLHTILVEGVLPPYGTAVSPSSGDRIDPDTLHELDSAFRTATVPWVKQMIARLTLAILDKCTAPIVYDQWPSPDFSHLANAAGVALNLGWYNVLAPSMSPTDFTTAVARTVTPITVSRAVRRTTVLQPLLSPFVAALDEAPASERMQKALVALLQFEGRQRRAPDVAAVPDGQSMDAWLLRCISGSATRDHVPTIAHTLAKVTNESELSDSLTMLDLHERSRDLLLPIIEAIVALPDASPLIRSIAVEFLANKLAHAPANLASPEQWAAAGLPAPAPMENPAERPDKPGAQIASIEIDNVRAFSQRFEVQAPRPEGQGQWMVFLGENATGKTTLLRAVAMALASPADAAAVPSNLEGPIRRDGAVEGVARVKTVDGRDLKAAVVTGADGKELVTSHPEGPKAALRPWVVGYGCRRGSAISSTDVDNAFAPFRDLDNLFDRPRGLIRASGWLKELQRLSKNNGARSKLVFEAARESLQKMLLGAGSIEVTDEVYVEIKGRGRVPLALLSDGYLTTAGWVVDLMARWIKRQEGLKKTVDENFCSNMEGVVLLDEIDLHLHPKWQEQVIEDVRKQFPKMTFLATTHHPLTLRGARKGEVFVLGDHDGTGTVTAIQRDIPPGTRIDELITGAWFDRPSAIVDAETRKMLDDHQKMILSGVKAGEPKRKALEAQLRERLGRYADTSLERLAATIVAKHLGETLPEPSAQKREEVKESVLKILKRRDAKRGR
jgi:energy-coupling factor transporter ATP-binding protein EcfA2